MIAVIGQMENTMLAVMAVVLPNPVNRNPWVNASATAIEMIATKWARSWVAMALKWAVAKGSRHSAASVMRDKCHGPGWGEGAGPFDHDECAPRQQPAQYQQPQGPDALRLVCRHALWVGPDRMECMMWHGVLSRNLGSVPLRDAIYASMIIFPVS